MSKRATNAELHEREQLIIENLQNNVKVSVICELLAEKYNCSTSAIRKQYEKIMKELRAGTKEDKELLRSQMSLQMDLAYEMAKDKKNSKVMIDAIKEKARLHGLYDREETAKDEMPDFIEYGEKDFSKGPVLVGDKVDEK